VATPEWIFLFDLIHLGQAPALSTHGATTVPRTSGKLNSVASGEDTTTASQLCSHAEALLRELFSRRDIVKVGWDFGSKDIEKLQCSGGATGEMWPFHTLLIIT
jgi:hypothetical protein